MYDSTLIVFSSDNGAGYGPANGRLRGKKGFVFEGGVRVPAFVHGPPLLREMEVEPGYTSPALGRNKNISSIDSQFNCVYLFKSTFSWVME